MLRYLSKLELTPGQTVRLVDVAPFSGPVSLEIIRDSARRNGDSVKVVGNELAVQLFVLPS